MTSFKRAGAILLAGTACIALSACGADDIASPGTGGNVIINPAPSPSPSPSPSPTPTPGVTPASGCPTIADPQGLTDGGTIEGPTGTYRVCVLPSRINKSVTLTKIAGLLYQLPGRVDVGTDGGATASANDTNVTLTIDPGVIVYANTGVAWLAVNRGNKIHAVGTATQPIIFTSRDNVLGLNTDNSSGQWGGVVLMGRAPVTDCTVAPNATPGTAQCERQTEGAVDPAIYGGATGNDSSGQMSFVQIRYSGYVLSANNELQSLTPEGVGSGTKLDHIMSFNSSDDGAEFFGRNRQNEVGVAVRQKALHRALARPLPEPAAVHEGLQRHIELIGVARGRIHEALDAPGDMRDEQIRREQSGRGDPSQPKHPDHPHAGEKEQRAPDCKHQHGLAEVRLGDQKRNQHQQQRQRHRGRRHFRASCRFREQPRHNNDEGWLRGFGGLDVDAEQSDPAPRTLDLGTKQQRRDDQHQRKREHDQRAPPNVLGRQERCCDHHDDRRDEEQHMAIEEVKRIEADAHRDRRAGRQRQDDACNHQRKDCSQQQPIHRPPPFAKRRALFAGDHDEASSFTGSTEPSARTRSRKRSPRFSKLGN